MKTISNLASMTDDGRAWLWSRTAKSPRPEIMSADALQQARRRMARFAPALAALFPEKHWDGTIASPLRPLDWPALGNGPVFVKCDHQLPMTGSIKARGGVYELLCWLEAEALKRGLLKPGDDPTVLLAAECRRQLGEMTIAVASTGNLGFSIGLVGRAFGCRVIVHMSADAKGWKKERLRAVGADVVEHDGDYGHAVAAARAWSQSTGVHFVDDENSPTLMLGYALAGEELVDQRRKRPSGSIFLVASAVRRPGSAQGYSTRDPTAFETYLSSRLRLPV
jgi:D-serine dehydratase